jgi:translocation and assembly module TamB
MEESDALANLARPSAALRLQQRATSVSDAVTSIGLIGGERIAQAIGGEFGVDEVSVSSEYSQDAPLLLGKYLSPRRYLQYAVVFSDALNITRLRYELTNHWYIKLESGEQQSADILYTFER